MPITQKIRQTTRNRKNKNLAIPAAAAAIPVNPKSAATSAITRKIRAQRSMLSPPTKQSLWLIAARVSHSKRSPKAHAAEKNSAVRCRQRIHDRETNGLRQRRRSIRASSCFVHSFGRVCRRQLFSPATDAEALFARPNKSKDGAKCVVSA
jgi:hypothetical protein